jgi:hypothetical protein
LRDESRTLSWGNVSRKVVGEVMVDVFGFGAFGAANTTVAVLLSALEVVSLACRRCGPMMGNPRPAWTLEIELDCGVR